MRPAFSVVVPTFNRSHLLERIIISLADQSNGFEDVQLIICDSGSTDGTSAMVAEWVEKYPASVTHIHTLNIVSRKRNEGLSLSRYEHVIFLDDDCVPAPDFLDTYGSLAVRHLAGESRTVLCGETRFPERWMAKSNYYRFQDSRHFDHGAASAGVPLNFKTIVTMNMCVRKSSFVAGVVGFDETFVGYGAEDQEIGWRLERAGFSIVACDALAVHHEMSGGIHAFGDKIRRTARDGMTQLLAVAPEAAQSIRLAKFLDASYPDRSIIDKLVLAGFRASLVLGLHKLLGWALSKTDEVQALYFPPAYRAYMACCYALGADQRAHRLSAEDAAVGWGGRTH